MNAEKCKFWCNQIKFLGHAFSKNGVTPNPTKAAAIKEMEAPANITELHRFMGIVNQFGKFLPHLAQLSSPFRELLSINQAWLWDTKQEEAFKNIKIEVINPTVMALYTPQAETKISEDVSSHGLEAVLLQLEESWRSVAYVSRAITNTEC